MENKMGNRMENELDSGCIQGSIYMRVIYGLYRGYIGIMEKKMETTIVYWGSSRDKKP